MAKIYSYPTEVGEPPEWDSSIGYKEMNARNVCILP